jgi:hypothetical protein
MKDIFNELGLNARVNKGNYTMIGNRKQAYVVVIRGDKMFHKFIELIKPANPKHMAKYERYRKSFKCP